MIELTSLVGKALMVNAEQIRWLETSPDTIVCFVDGTRVPVKETPDQIREKFLTYKKQIFQISQER
jgi:flagellar protein FlbD